MPALPSADHTVPRPSSVAVMFGPTLADARICLLPSFSEPPKLPPPPLPPPPPPPPFPVLHSEPATSPSVAQPPPHSPRSGKAVAGKKGAAAPSPVR